MWRIMLDDVGKSFCEDKEDLIYIYLGDKFIRNCEGTIISGK